MTRFGRNVLQCRDCEIGYMEGFPADLGDVYSHEDYNDKQETNYLHNVDYRKQRFALERLNIIRRHITKPVSSTRLLDVGAEQDGFSK